MKLTWSVADLVQLTGISKNSIYREIAAGRLRRIKVGHRTLFRQKDVDRWLSTEKSVSAEDLA